MRTLFHETRPENEPSILRGFQDVSEIERPGGTVVRGVWVSDRPIRHRTPGVVFAIETDFSDDELAGWQPYRPRPDYGEFLIPADRLNVYPISIIERR